jgi:hypothetical protein
MKSRKLWVEQLESRRLLTASTYGALQDDTAEYMLGSVAVTVVLLESNGLADSSTENWTDAHRQEVVQRIQDGLDWWKQSLAQITSKHRLDFLIDRKFIDSAFSTGYEPISRRSDDFSLWVDEFLDAQGFGSGSLLDDNMRAFNHSQRLKHKTDWAFTIFVVNSQNDSDGQFASSGSHKSAFSFAGGLFQVVPSTSPASTYAHETGHMFWALDEYSEGASYYRRRGYYNTQNTNALVANPNTPFIQSDSIMADGLSLERAYLTRTSPASTFAMVGWKDSDQDGIFDVLDLPITLDAIGQYDKFSGLFSWSGDARVGTLPNLNSSGNQSSISIDKIARLETRIDGGDWIPRLFPNSASVSIDLVLALGPVNEGKVIDLRAVSDLGINSEIFSATVGPATSSTGNGGIHGFVWNDLNRDGQWGELESGLSGQTVTIRALSQVPSGAKATVRASLLDLGPITTLVNGVSISSEGTDADGRVGVLVDPDSGRAVFNPYLVGTPNAPSAFKGTETKLKLAFPNGTRRVDVATRGVTNDAIVRIDAFRSNGTIIARAESGKLDSNSDTVVALEVSESIAYAIVYGHKDSTFSITEINTGHPMVVSTDALGGFGFPNLAAGDYEITASPDGESVQLLGNPTRIVVVGDVSNPNPRSDFSFLFVTSAWTNPSNAFDTNNDGRINGVDVMIVINTINRHGGGKLSASGLSPRPFVDVNNDGFLNPLDALAAINYVNMMFASNGQGQGESSFDIATDIFELDPLNRDRKPNAFNLRVISV